MRVLIDTNILTRLAEAGHRQHEEAEEAVWKLEALEHELVLVPQVLYEYWVVVTRPVENNGLGMSAKDADRAVDVLIELFTLLRDERNIFNHWRDLVVRHDVKGKGAHDTRLVAGMLRHGISHILTFNSDDFGRFPMIRVVTPAQVIAGALG